MKRVASPRRNPRIALRPQQRKARNRRVVSILAILVLGAAFVLSWARFKKSVFTLKQSLVEDIPSPKTVELEGVPDSLKPQILSFLNAQSLNSWKSQGSKIMERFPFLKSAHLSRDFFSRGLVYHIVLRQAVAVVSGGNGRNFMDDKGNFFKAPKELYAESLPEIQDSNMDSKALRQAASFLNKIASLNLPSPIESLRYLSPVNGWSVELQDGTLIDWGDFRWTKEKVKRLNAVLADAKTYAKGNFFVDMRSFGNGKIFVKPAVSKALARGF